MNRIVVRLQVEGIIDIKSPKITSNRALQNTIPANLSIQWTILKFMAEIALELVIAIQDTDKQLFHLANDGR